MMIGYPKNTKGYKLWDFNLQKVVISRDVLFAEVRQSNEICVQESENENIRKTPSSEMWTMMGMTMKGLTSSMRAQMIFQSWMMFHQF
jgi:hypothetical protein